MNEKTVALLHQLVDQKIVPGVSYAMIYQDDCLLYTSDAADD